MQRSTVGNAPLIGVVCVEPIKWLALALMLVEHAWRYVLEEFPVWVYMAGRNVFPLFAIALAVGLAQSDLIHRRNVVLRLSLWGAISAVPIFFVHDVFPLNVLFTFALGVTLYSVLRGLEFSRFVIAALILVAGFTVEFGPVGVVAVAASCFAARSSSRSEELMRWSLAAVAFSAAAQSIFVLPAFVMAFVLSSMPVELPRVRGFFYWAYAGHWSVIAALRGVL